FFCFLCLLWLIPLLSRTVMRYGPANLQRTEVRSAAGEIIIDAGESDAGIDCGRSWPKLKIEISRPVQLPRIRPRRRDLHECVIVDKNAVLVLTGGIAVFLQGFEAPDLSRLGFQLCLRLSRKLSHLARKVRPHI